MALEMLGPEIITGHQALAFLVLPLLGLAYTKAQRQFIIERDGGICNAPWKHICVGYLGLDEVLRKLQVHHILPQRYCDAVGIENPDFPENGITLCKNAHVGPQGVHPDIFGAHTKDDFKRVFDARKKKLDERKIYWDDSHDRQMHVIAVKNQQRFEKEGRIFPIKRK